MVGQCTGDESHAANGDALQTTTGGLLVWRKADNWTAFTDGATTWINGPAGIQSRPNNQRFPWETAPVTPSGPLQIGETWPGVGLTLTLNRVDFGITGTKHTVTLVYTLANTGNDTQLLTFDQGRDIYLTDNRASVTPACAAPRWRRSTKRSQPGEGRGIAVNDHRSERHRVASALQPRRRDPQRHVHGANSPAAEDESKVQRRAQRRHGSRRPVRGAAACMARGGPHAAVRRAGA